MIQTIDKEELKKLDPVQFAICQENVPRIIQLTSGVHDAKLSFAEMAFRI